MPSQAVIEFLSSPDIINVVNNVVVSPDLHYTISAGNSFWLGVLTFLCIAIQSACLVLQVLLLLKQCRINQEANINTDFKNENQLIRGELSLICADGKLLCQNILFDIQEQSSHHGIIRYIVCQIEKNIIRRISSLNNIEQEIDEDVKNALNDLNKDAYKFKEYCGTFQKTATTMDPIPDIKTLCETLESSLEGLKKSVKNKKYVIKKKPHEKEPWHRFIRS